MNLGTVEAGNGASLVAGKVTADRQVRPTPKVGRRCRAADISVEHSETISEKRTLP